MTGAMTCGSGSLSISISGSLKSDMSLRVFGLVLGDGSRVTASSCFSCFFLASDAAFSSAAFLAFFLFFFVLVFLLKISHFNFST